MPDYTRLIARPALRDALEIFRGLHQGTRITIEDLTAIYNRITAGQALTKNELGRALSQMLGVKSYPDRSQRWVRVLDGNRNYLPAWQPLFGDDGTPTPVRLDPMTVAARSLEAELAATPAPASTAGGGTLLGYAPGTLLRVREDRSLEVVSDPESEPTRLAKKRTVQIRAEDPTSAPQAGSDSGGGRLASADELRALRDKLGGSAA